MGFAAKEYGAKLVKVALGYGGLGVFVRAGLVSPPSLVSSAVDARLALLIIDRRRARSFEICISDLRISASVGDVWKAFVNRDTLRVLSGRTSDFWKSGCGGSRRGVISGGSSTSAARSSSAIAGEVAVVWVRHVKKSCNPISYYDRDGEGAKYS